MSEYSPEPPSVPPIPPATPAAPPPVPPSGSFVPPYSPPVSADGTSPDIRTKAMLCHLLAFAGVLIPFGSILGPLVMWLTQKEKSPFIDYHGKESLNFQITVALALIVTFVLWLIVIGVLLTFAVGIYAVVMTIIAAIKTNEGQYYKYPFTLRLVN